MKKIISLITLTMIASFSYAQSLDFTSGFTIDDTGLDTFGSTASASGVSFSGSDFGNTVSGGWASAQDLSSWSSAAGFNIFGTITEAPTSNFAVVLYDAAFATVTLAGGSWTNMLATGSDDLSAQTPDAGFDWSTVQYVDINTGGLGDTVTGTLTGISIVPEPSTYALIAGFAAFLLVAIRRRK